MDQETNNKELQTNPLEMTGEIGISEQDKQEVLQHIDAVVAENKIDAADEAFELKSINSGIRFPLIVNIVTIVVIAAVVLTLSWYFGRSEKSVLRSSLEYTSIEGQLIKELRQESQEQITAKDRKITEIQARISELESQRKAIVESIDEKVTGRQVVYRERVLTEVADRKSRLEAQGLIRRNLRSF